MAAGFCGQLGDAKGLVDRQAAVLTLLCGFFALGTCVCLVGGLVYPFLCMYFPPPFPSGVNLWDGFISCAGLVKDFFVGCR